MKQYLQSFANRASAIQAVQAAAVGVLHTVVAGALFNRFHLAGRAWVPTVSRSVASTPFKSPVDNRYGTFDLRDGKVSGAETVSFFGVNLVAYLATVGIMWFAETVFGPLGTVGYNAAMLAAAGLLILPKLAGYRDIVFSKALAQPDAAVVVSVQE